ncbi:MAG: hypothetical protein J0M24_08755 [Verrucomicrobia bacterium]|nr:hypothetical protein [Verrucomicrobiota bacterium]
MILRFRTLPFFAIATAAVCPLATMGALLVPVSETHHSHVQGFVELYDPAQLPDDIVIIASDSFSGSFRGSASASDWDRYASVSAESSGGRKVTSNRIELELWNSVSYTQQGHFLELQSQSLNEYRLTFELTQPSTVHLTGFLDSNGPGPISTDAEIQLAGWQLSLARDGDSLTFGTTVQLDAGRYTFAATSSALLPNGECCSEDEEGYAQLQVAAVFDAGSTQLPEPAPKAIGPAVMLVALLNWRRRIPTRR